VTVFEEECFRETARDLALAPPTAPRTSAPTAVDDVSNGGRRWCGRR
jgi:hypothetical protein